MIELTISSNMGEVRQRMVLASNTLDDWRPFFREWHELWIDSRAAMFESSGASIGSPWPMYSRLTKEHQYAAVKSSIFGRKLVRQDLLTWLKGSERLRPSFLHTEDPYHVYEESADMAAYGSALPYASNHDEGTGKMPAWAGGHAIPKRPLLLFGSDLEEETSFLAGVFAAAGLHSIDEKGKARAGLSTSQVQELMRTMT